MMDLMPVRIRIEFDDGRFIDMDRRVDGMPAQVVNNFRSDPNGRAAHNLEITFPDDWLKETDPKHTPTNTD